MATKLEQLQGELYAKQSNLQGIYEQARKSDGTYDFLVADAFSHLETQGACIELLKQLEKEAEEKHAEVMTLQELHDREEKVKQRSQQLKEIDKKHQHAGTAENLGRPAPMKSLGSLIKEAWPDGNVRRHGPILLDREFKNWDLSMLTAGYEYKALMERTAGWAPEATRIPRIVELVSPRIVVTDLLPVGNTSEYLIKYMRETVATNTAAETLEGAASVEATLTLQEVSVPVEKIPIHLTVTEEQLADVEQVAGYVDARLRGMVRDRLENQLILGDGVAPNLQGFLNAGVLNQPLGGDDVIDAIYKAINQVRVTGGADPSAVVIHPFNFAPVRLAKTANGYIWGHPSIPGPTSMFGVPVVETSRITLGTALTGDFAGYSQLWMRHGVEVQIGFVNTTFIEGKQVIRVTLRAALAVYRPAAFATITGLGV